MNGAEVVVSENIRGAALDELSAQFRVVVEPQLWRSAEQLHQAVSEARALIVRNQTQVTAELLAAAPNLEIVGRAGAGLDNIDTQAAVERGIVVVYAPHENSISAAEMTIGLILSLARNIAAANQDTHNGGWNRARFTGSELFGKTLGVVGLGRIGTLTAERAKAFGMSIIAHDDFIDPNAEHVQRLAARLVALDELLATTDVVTVHTPLTDATRGMFAYEQFRQMKPTALFINASRGEVVDEAGLARALSEKRLAGAALDVRSKEPPGEGDSLAAFDNVVLTPHIAAFTHEAQDRVVAAVCRDVAAVLRGDCATNFFNFARPRKNSP